MNAADQELSDRTPASLVMLKARSCVQWMAATHKPLTSRLGLLSISEWSCWRMSCGGVWFGPILARVGGPASTGLAGCIARRLG